jgi:aspartyl-tRNA(Asn)/glutamyl-tRNA(Gln) amidotransferase subunit B
LGLEWEIVVGLEVHAQLKTRSKIFSGAAVDFGQAPNVNASAIDIALPGVLPVANRAAVECAIKFGLAVHGRISGSSVFARKNYFYPDLPKGYQISQYELPIVSGGEVPIEIDGVEKTVRLTRAHLEEDAGKSLHAEAATGIDLNRAGTPLLEIVSEPDMRSADEAVGYAKALHELVVFLDICDGNMQEGSFRADANVSVRRRGEPKLGTRCEIKNLNSFRFLKHAIEFEAVRQIDVLEASGKIDQETRLYDPEKNETRSMRSKEEAHDYRYFPDPDLLPIAISPEWLEEVRRALPELPGAKRARYVNDLGLSPYDARVLTSSRDISRYFEEVLASGAVDAKLATNWINGILAAALNESGATIAESPVRPIELAALLVRHQQGALNTKTAKEAFDALWKSKLKVVTVDFAIPVEWGAAAKEVDRIIQERGLKQLSDTDELETIVDDIIAGNPRQVDEYRGGKEKVLAFFVGQAMKATHGRANPAALNEILKRKLAR